MALVSDAGTPLVSDPGYKLVQAAIDEDLPVLAVPGPSAALAALVISGLPSDRFFFAGFLPAKAAARRAALATLAAVPGSLIFFESAGRLAASLEAMTRQLGPRPAAVARELTKRFEEVRRGTLDQLAAHYRHSGAPKGEIVVVVGPPVTKDPDQALEDLDERLRRSLEDGASLRDAVAQVTAETGLPRRQVYQRALALGADTRDDEAP